MPKDTNRGRDCSLARISKLTTTYHIEMASFCGVG